MLVPLFITFSGLLLYSFQQRELLNPSRSCFANFKNLLSLVDEVTMGTYSLGFVILNVAEFPALDLIKLSIQFNGR